MKKIFSYLMLMIAVLVPVSCDDESWNPEELVIDKGELSLSSMGIVTHSDDESVMPVADYIVSILNSDNQTVSQWKHADRPKTLPLPVGTYVINVKSHELQAAEWDKPYYYASRTFTIEKGTVTELDTVECRLSNVMVTVVYDDALAGVLGDDVKVSVSVGTGSLEYIYGEQRAGCFALPEGSNTLVAVLKGEIDGEEVSSVKTYTDIEAGDCRVIEYTVEDVDNHGGTADPNAPTIESETLDINGVNIVTEDLIAKVDINAPNGVEKFIVEIISETLNADVLADVGLAAEFDLAHPGELDEVLVELGFPTGENVIGATYLPFDISDFMALLSAFPGIHQFRLTVTDAEGLETAATLTFLVE